MTKVLRLAAPLAAACLASGAVLHSPKGGEHAASLGKAMAKAPSLLPSASLPLRPPHTNVVLSVAWDASIDPTVIGYRAYWGPAGNLTNVVDVGSTNFCTLTLPLGGPTWIGVTAYDTVGLESLMSNLIHWPLFQAVIVTGSNLQCRPDLLLSVWQGTNSPYAETNPTGSMFFRSTDPGGPTIQGVMTQ